MVVLIRQHWANRFGAVVPGGCLIAATVFTVTFPLTVPGVIVGLVFVGVPIWLIVRSIRASVECTDERLVIRGWIWSRSIPRADVTSVSSRRFIHWNSPSGSNRLTPLPLFWDFPTSWTSMDIYNEEAITCVNRWLKAGGK